MKKSISMLLVASIIFAGCAGRKPNPIHLYVPGDEDRSCESLNQEISNLQNDMNTLKPDVNKADTNALWFVAGCFLIVPFFFMDLKDAEKVEYNALSNRVDRLSVYAAEKCGKNKMVSENSEEYKEGVQQE